MDSFDLNDYLRAEKTKVWAPDPAIAAQVTSLTKRLHALCGANGIPLFVVTVYKITEEGYDVSATTNFPITRVPKEILIMSTLAHQGLVPARQLIDVLMAAEGDSNE